MRDHHSSWSSGDRLVPVVVVGAAVVVKVVVVAVEVGVVVVVSVVVVVGVVVVVSVVVIVGVVVVVSVVVVISVVVEGKINGGGVSGSMKSGGGVENPPWSWTGPRGQSPLTSPQVPLCRHSA